MTDSTPPHPTMQGVLSRHRGGHIDPVISVETTRTERSSRRIASQIRVTQAAMAKQVLPLRVATTGPA